MSFNNAFDKKKMREEANRASADFGTGEFLMRPEDTSIQGASEDFMKYLNDPFAEVKQDIADDEIIDAAAPGREMFDQLKGNNTPDLPQDLASQPMSQESGMSSKGPKTEITSPSIAPISAPQEDILAQLKAARAANEVSLSNAKEIDEMTNMKNRIRAAGSQMSEGFANRGGYTDIKLKSREDTANEMDQAGVSAKSKLEALMQDYGIKKSMEDTAYSRKKDTLDRNERIAARAEENSYKDRMIEATKAKTKEESSVGQRKEDQEFAKDFNTYTSSGRNKAVSSLNKLKGLVTTLQKEGDGIFAAGGGRTAGLPSIMRNRDSIQWKADAVNSANDFLKETFAGAISNEERQALAEGFYNDELPNSKNVEILNRKIAEMEASLNAKDEKAKYFQENKRTLSGYSSALTPLDSTKKPSQTSAKSSPTTGQIISSGGKRYKVINDNGDLEEVK